MMRDQMQLSVAMCTYNGVQYLQEQLDSILAQIRQPDELVVCDDRSSDDTRCILRAFCSRAPFPVRVYINDLRLGSTKNFEKAIRLCEGDIIALSDQDDVWDPQKLMTYETILSESVGAGAVFTDAEVVDEDLQPLGYRQWEYVNFRAGKQKRVSEGRAVEVLLKRNVVAGASMAFRAAYKDVVLPIPNMWVHDAWIALLIAAVAELAMIKESLHKYRQHSTNHIGLRMTGLLKEMVRAKHSQANVFWDRVEYYKALYARLLALSGAGYGVRSEVFRILEEKIMHWVARASMPENKLSRVPLVLRELATLRYFRHSRGLKSIAGDLLLR